MFCSDWIKLLQGYEGYSVVIPAISVSNAGQLAVDLLIQSSGAVKVTNLWNDSFIPLVGADPFKEDSVDLCTESEVYHLEKHKILFIQLRSPIWKSKEQDFLSTLVRLFEQLEVKQVVILSSLYDYERTDNQIKDARIRCCFCPKTQHLFSTVLRQLNCRYVEEKGNEELTGVMTKDTFLPGAGFTQSLHLQCINSKVPCLSFFKFCSDGDNRPEAFELANTVEKYLGIASNDSKVAKSFIQPPSWKYIFGGPSPQELFP